MDLRENENIRKRTRWLRITTIVVASTAFILTTFCIGLKTLPAHGVPAKLAAHWLIPPHLISDWNWSVRELSKLNLTNGELAEHVKLAGLQRRWYFKTPDPNIHRLYVINPSIPGTNITNWRRPLWEGLSQLVRRSKSNTEAALIVRRKLYLRLTPRQKRSKDVLSTWKLRQGNSHDFEQLSVAALRSVGVPARLTNNLAEYYDSNRWLRFPDVDDYVAVIRSGNSTKGD